MERFHRPRCSSPTSSYELPSSEDGSYDVQPIDGDLDDTTKLLYPSAAEYEPDSTIEIDETAASFLHQPVEDLVLLHTLNTHLSSVRLPTLHNILDCTPLLLITLYETLPPVLTPAGTYKRHRRIPYVVHQGENADMPTRMQNMKFLISTIVNDESLRLDEKLWRRLVGLDLRGFCEKKGESVRRVLAGVVEVVGGIVEGPGGGPGVGGELSDVEKVSRDMGSILGGMVRPSLRLPRVKDSTGHCYGPDKRAKPPYETPSARPGSSLGTARPRVSQEGKTLGLGIDEVEFASSSSDGCSSRGLRRRYLALKPTAYFSPRRKEDSTTFRMKETHAIPRQSPSPRLTPTPRPTPSSQPTSTPRHSPLPPESEPQHHSSSDEYEGDATSPSVSRAYSRSGHESPDALRVEKNTQEGLWRANWWLEEQADLLGGPSAPEDIPLPDDGVDGEVVQEKAQDEDEAVEDEDDTDIEVLEEHVRELLLRHGYKIRP